MGGGLEESPSSSLPPPIDVAPLADSRSAALAAAVGGLRAAQPHWQRLWARLPATRLLYPKGTYPNGPDQGALPRRLDSKTRATGKKIKKNKKKQKNT